MVRWALALAAIVVLSSCGGSSGGGTAPASIKLTACTVENVAATCGSLPVPENPSQSSGRTISLRVVVLPARSSSRAPDPLFYFEGGPGGAAAYETAWVRQHFYVLNQRHDIVLIDQRGTGGSNQRTCQTSGVAAADDAGIEAGVKACLDQVRDNADPSYYTTPIAVDDFDKVRAALGYDKVDVYGISYGVSSGLAYLQRHGDHVRTAVFDSGSLLNFHIMEQVPKSAQQSLKLLFQRCRADAACNAAFPHVDAEFASIVAQVTARPVMTQVMNPAGGGNVVIDVSELANVVISGYLATSQTAASLPKDIHAAFRGDWTAIANAAVVQGQGENAIPVMSVTVRCGDEWASHDPAAAAAAAPGSPFTQFEVRFLTGYSGICKYWPSSTGASGRVQSTAPIVFLNSTGDPVDPPANVAAAAADMPNSLVVPVAGTGHWQLDHDSTGCLDDETAAFIEAGKPATLAMWPCAASPPLPAFQV